jgi:hypothetical protein
MTEQEYQERMGRARQEYQTYRENGGDLIALDWLWQYDPDLFGEMQSRWRFQSSYTCVSGGVMFHPLPQGRRRRK